MLKNPILNFVLVLILSQNLWVPSSFAAFSERDLRSVETDRESQIRNLRDQEITQLRIALGRRLEKQRSADLYYRLAELYLEAYRAAYLLEGRVFDQKIKEGARGIKIDHSRSRSYVAKGIQASERVIELNIPFDKTDTIYYFLAFYYGELGNSKKSQSYFRQIIGRYPNSPFVFEAYREVGDEAYRDQKYSQAQSYYLQALEKSPSDSPLRAPILHKLGWCYYRQRQFTQAVSTLKKAIDEASKDSEKYLSVREEALRDIALFMIEAGQTEEALSYFSSVAGNADFYPRVLEQLAKEYERQAQPLKAVKVYEQLLKMKSDAGDTAEALRLLVKLVELDLKKQRYSDVLKRVQSISLPSSVDGQSEVHFQNVKAMVRRTATQNHQAWRKNPEDKSELKIAESFYSVYLNRLLPIHDPKNEKPEIQMYLAEVKRDLGKAGEASDLYSELTRTGDQKYSQKAGALLVASLAEDLKKESGTRIQKKGSSPSEKELEFVRASDQLATTAPGTNEAREAELRSAQVLAGYTSTENQGLERAKKLATQYPNSTQAVTAAQLWLQIQSDRVPDVKRSSPAQYRSGADALKSEMSEIRAIPGLLATDAKSGGKLRAELDRLDHQMQVSTISLYEKSSDFDDAAREYENFAKNQKDTVLAEKAYENAMASYSKAGDFESVSRVGSDWLKRFPTSTRVNDSLRATATAFLIQGKYELSAELFERLGSRGSDASSYETAARLFESLGNIDRSQKIYSSYVSMYSKSGDVWRVSLQAGKSLERAQRLDQAAKRYEHCSNGPFEFEAECSARLADIYYQYKEQDRAQKLYAKVASLGGKNSKGKSSPYVGYARYRQAEILEKNSNFDTLALPEAQLKRALGQRLEFFKKLNPAYLSVVDAGGAWGMAALYRLASWSLQFADEVDRIQPPSNASDAARVAFQQSLTSISQPLRKKAVETLQQAYQKAVDQEILSPMVPEIADALVRLQSTPPHRAQGFRGGLRLAGLPAQGGPEGAGASLKKTRDVLIKNPKDTSAWVNYGNLLWGEGKPLLAEIAYEQALSFNPQHLSALNNKAIVLLTGEGFEDWVAAARAQALLDRASGLDAFFVAAKMNRAVLLNYYRIFAKARSVWEQVLVRTNPADAQDGLAIAQMGLGRFAESESAFAKADALGLSKNRFARVFHASALHASRGNFSECSATLDRIHGDQVTGFERQSIDRLKKDCELWKTAK